MHKAILELEMPESCRECPFYKITDICDILSAWNNYMPDLICMILANFFQKKLDLAGQFSV